jgi:hypothetical protein
MLVFLHFITGVPLLSTLFLLRSGEVTLEYFFGSLPKLVTQLLQAVSTLFLAPCRPKLVVIVQV